MFSHCDEFRNSFLVVGKNDVRIAPRHSSSGAWPGHFFKFELHSNFGELVSELKYLCFILTGEPCDKEVLK